MIRNDMISKNDT